MSKGPEQQRLSPAERTNLVAYLDRELNEAETRAITTKLTQSVTARRELEALEKTWELLDYLPRPQPSPEFTARTLSQVKLLNERGEQLLGVADKAARRAARILTVLLSAVITIAAAYAITRWVIPDHTARLIRDLSLAEHLDEYVEVGSYAFLRQLDDSPEFTEEISLLATDAHPNTAKRREQRLRSMPRAERQLLAQALDRFDLLSPSEQTAVREMDSELARLEPANRARLESVLRHYYLWVQGLPAVNQAELRLKDLGEQKRIEVVKKLRQTSAAQRSQAGRTERAMITLSGLVGVFETARMLQVWATLPRTEREKIDRMKKDDQRREALRKVASERGLATNAGPTKEEWSSVSQHVNVTPRLRKNFEVVKAKSKLAQAKQWAEASYFLERDFDVSSENLARFEAVLPDWALAHLDPLPPEAARRRLAAIYRLIYPPGTEMAHEQPKREAPGSGRGSQPAQARPSTAPSNSLPF